MIHYHGSPISGKREDKHIFYQGRHALVPWFRKDDIEIIAEVCKSFVFDNSAFSIWKRGGALDVAAYTDWVQDWCRHPSFRWALIPDTIEGNERDNDKMVDNWPEHLPGVPVWHLHESMERLVSLCEEWPTVALGSSGEYSTPNSKVWWTRVEEFMPRICDDKGRAVTKLHGLRMLNPRVFSKLPLTSADSTNAGMNSGAKSKFGVYVPMKAAQRANIIADRVESHNSAATWETQCCI